MSEMPVVSLLWPDANRAQASVADEGLITDLNLKPLIEALSLDREMQKFIGGLLTNLCTDNAVIGYRQSIIADLLRLPELINNLSAIHETITHMHDYLSFPQWQENMLQHVAWRLSELEGYVECTTQLYRLLMSEGDALQSSGFLRLREQMESIVHTPTFQRLRDELPRMLSSVRAIVSITIGINLDAEMRPLSVILLSANTKHFSDSSSFMRWLFKPRGEGEGPVGPLHDARKVNFGGHEFTIELRDRNSPFMPPLFKDLSNLMDETSRPIAGALKHYNTINTTFLLSLRQEIGFYLSAAKLIQRFQEVGLTLCYPNIRPMEARTTVLTGLYNIGLALQRLSRRAEGEAIIANDAVFDETGRIFILTGPNQGGKTTYTQAIGQTQMLFQAGLPVPAEAADMSPVDGIYTHFAREERPDLEAGRLGEEARRLSDIFGRATRYSLILLNESLSSTSPMESLYLARDVVRALRLLGSRAIYATHLLDLAADCEVMNTETTGESKIISMVSVVQTENDGQAIRRTYRIIAAPPMSKSYAQELAARYGLSFEQLESKLRARKVL